MNIFYSIGDFFNPIESHHHKDFDDRVVGLIFAAIFISAAAFFVYEIRYYAYSGLGGSYGMGIYTFIPLAMLAISGMLGGVRLRAFFFIAAIAVTAFVYYVPVNMSESKHPNDAQFKQVYDAMR